VSWYWWVLIWAFVLLLALGVMFLLGLSLWRKTKALGRELAQASERLSAVSEQLQELSERGSEAPAVFTPASQLRQQRILGARGRDARQPGGQSAQPGTRSPRSPNQRVR
jgi:hypothetical protein